MIRNKGIEGKMPVKKRIAVFISGRGSNFKSILDKVNEGYINGEIVVLISDNPDAKGLGYAVENNIPYKIFEFVKGIKRDIYFENIIEFLEDKDIDLILLAGFMRVLSQNIIRRYKNRIINIHPALLPSFPGTNAQKQAIEYGVKISGCTVHFVDEGVDTGPIIMQAAVKVFDNDTEESLAARILEQEHRIYPESVKLFCEDRLKVVGRKVLIV